MLLAVGGSDGGYAASDGAVSGMSPVDSAAGTARTEAEADTVQTVEVAEKCYVCLCPKDDQIQWLACGHWLHMQCAMEAMRVEGLDDIASIRCGECKKRGEEIQREASSLMPIPDPPPSVIAAALGNDE